MRSLPVFILLERPWLVTEVKKSYLKYNGLKKGHFNLTFSSSSSSSSLSAAVLGSNILKNYLVNYARPLIYSTFMSFSSLASIKCAYDILENGDTVPVIHFILHKQMDD